jgi:hypothetical protein
VARIEFSAGQRLIVRLCPCWKNLPPREAFALVYPMATSSLRMLLTSTTNLADVLTTINAMEVAAARRHRARILGLMSV